jgi:hypothetical protein
MYQEHGKNGVFDHEPIIRDSKSAKEHRKHKEEGAKGQRDEGAMKGIASFPLPLCPSAPLPL